MQTPAIARHWLIKSEPEVFSIRDLARVKVTGWEGVRNFLARNLMRDLMAPGELALFYHSNAEPSGVAGVARVHGEAVADPTQFQKKSEYYDATSLRSGPRWVMRHFEFVERFPELVPLATLRADPALRGMALLQKGQRLSVQEVSPAHFAHVVGLGRSLTRGRPGARW